MQLRVALQRTIFSKWAIFMSVWLAGVLATACSDSIGASNTDPLQPMCGGRALDGHA